MSSSLANMRLVARSKRRCCFVLAGTAAAAADGVVVDAGGVGMVGVVGVVGVADADDDEEVSPTGNMTGCALWACVAGCCCCCCCS